MTVLLWAISQISPTSQIHHPSKFMKAVSWRVKSLAQFSSFTRRDTGFLTCPGLARIFIQYFFFFSFLAIYELSIAKQIIFPVLCKSGAAVLCNSPGHPASFMATFCYAGVVDLSAFNLSLHKCALFSLPLQNRSSNPSAVCRWKMGMSLA